MSTMTVDPMEETDRNFPPKSEESLLTHASANYRIEGVIGHDSLSPPINTKVLEWDWHLFELTIAGEEIREQQQKSPPNSQKTESKQLQTDMAPKMCGSINDAAKAKARLQPKQRRKKLKKRRSYQCSINALAKSRRLSWMNTICPSIGQKLETGWSWIVQEISRWHGLNPTSMCLSSITSKPSRKKQQNSLSTDTTTTRFGLINQLQSMLGLSTSSPASLWMETQFQSDPKTLHYWKILQGLPKEEKIQKGYTSTLLSHPQWNGQHQ